MKLLAAAIVVAALIVAGAMWATNDSPRACDDNPFTEQPRC